MAVHGGTYEIRVAPGIGPRMAGAFQDMDVVNGNILRGVITDQAALHALFDVIQGFGLDIVEVRLVTP